MTAVKSLLSSLVLTAKVEVEEIQLNHMSIPVFIAEFWTSKQRQASSIHEISYRACFKPQLPRFFIQLFTKEKDLVYDPFGGRGTTAVESGLMGRECISNDINPLSEIITRPRFILPSVVKIEERLSKIPIKRNLHADIDLSMFFHPETEAEIVSLKKYLQKQKRTGEEDGIDRWIRMVATSRLTGHSSGFFSVYTLPPNQAVSQKSQIKINTKRNQIPEYRNTFGIIIKKTKSLYRSLSDLQVNNLKESGVNALFLNEDAKNTKEIKPGTVQLTVTSPPFLDVVQYSKDNWLRCWFNSIDINTVDKKITSVRTVEQWAGIMEEIFRELFRITKPGGWVAFEVGEVKKGRINLENSVVPLGLNAGFRCEGIMINSQKFTKTSNIWGINNNKSGTNTNRIILLRKPE